MPALLPSCMQLLEDGCTFIEGDVIQKLLEVSTDGVIECQNGFHQRPCNSNATGGHYKHVIEIKCIYDNSMLSMHYAIPAYHACQLLCEMYAKNAREAWYVVCSQKTVLLTTVQFDEEVWNKLFNIIKECYDVINPARPQQINKE